MKALIIILVVFVVVVTFALAIYVMIKKFMKELDELFDSDKFSANFDQNL